MKAALTTAQIAALPYRPCVGIVMVNAAGHVFAGTRADMDQPAWQMPQGGIDAGENPRAAAARELCEETGIAPDQTRFLRQTADWLTYDLPAEVIPHRWGGRYRGQKQHWIMVELIAPDSAIDLTYQDVEFSDWRWMSAHDLLAQIVPFKRDIYARVFREFELITA